MGDERPSREPAPEGMEDGVRGRRRREPRYGAFLTTGALVGVLAAAVLALVVAPPQTYSRGVVFGYLAVSLGLLGVLAGGLAAVLTSIQRRRHHDEERTSRTSRAPSSLRRKPTRGK